MAENQTDKREATVNWEALNNDEEFGEKTETVTQTIEVEQEKPTDNKTQTTETEVKTETDEKEKEVKTETKTESTPEVKADDKKEGEKKDEKAEVTGDKEIPEVLELKAEDVKGYEKQAEDGTWQAVAQGFGVKAKDESFEAVKEAVENHYKAQIEEAKKYSLENEYSKLKPETVTALKLIEMGVPQEEAFNPTSEHDKLLKMDNSTTSEISQRTSSDSGATWGLPVAIHTGVDEYTPMASRPIFVANSGRWMVAYDLHISGSLNSATGNYNGKTLYSDNEGVSWSEGGTTIASSGLCVESGFVYKPNGNIARYCRNRDGYITGFDTSDEGVTYGAQYNVTSGINSQSAIIKLSNGTYVLAKNDSARTNMKLYTSSDFSSWTETYTFESDVTLNFIEATMLEISSCVSVFYSQSNTGLDMYDLKHLQYPISLL